MEEYRIRVRIFIGLILVVIAILGGRLAMLQIINQDDFAEVSRGNALRDLRVEPARGAVFDRNGVLMVDNEPTYTVTVTPRNFDPANIPMLARLLEVPDSLVQARLDKAIQWSRYRPSPILEEVPFDVYSRFQEQRHLLRGIDVEQSQKRRYMTDAVASHALGYIREVSDAELDRFEEEYPQARYRQGDLVGKTGIEREYERFLRGEPGSEIKLVNKYGLIVKSYREGAEDTNPVGGYDTYLGIDSRVQALAESLFVNKRGGAVALDAKTGSIIALVSKPDFDPDVFSQTVDPATWNYLNNSPQKPLYNRATMNLMPPGSTWKPFMSLMALAEGNVAPTETYFCPGYHPLGGGRMFRCMGVHGPQHVKVAIKNSCNTFFFEMMMRTDPDTFSKYARMFGFGEKAPTDIREQTPGLIPDSSYYNRAYGEGRWTSGYTINLGIGQGDMGVTPLQLARYIAAVGNKGTLVTPHLVDSLVHPETNDVVLPNLPPAEEIPIDEEYFELVKEGMRLVMEQGTGVMAQIPEIPSGGKTGTAQAPGGMKDHSVFVMFAPWDDPQIAIAVQCENAGYGGQCAAPIASLMAELYLKGEIPDTPQKQVRMQRALGARSEPLPQRRSSSAAAGG
ncbi:MAG: penicillin-binding protein 2 [Rhodothermales bacterium]|nr:penicillin-binding protein 2 [Rhodothermales bacterium]